MKNACVIVKEHKHRRGMTLIEVLVALGVVSVGLTAALLAFGVSLNTLGAARDSLTYDRLIQEHWAELEAATVCHPHQAPVSGQGRFQAPDQDYAWIRTVIPVPHDVPDAESAPPGRLYDVELYVRRAGTTRGGESAHRLMLAGPFEVPDTDGPPRRGAR